MLTYDDAMRLSGRELREAVVERVLGFTKYESEAVADALRHQGEPVEDLVVWFREDGRYYCKHCGNMPLFESDIAAAWEVFERNGYFGSISYMGEEYVCELHAGFDEDGRGVNVQATGLTAPLAICRAALLEALRRKDS